MRIDNGYLSLHGDVEWVDALRWNGSVRSVNGHDAIHSCRRMCVGDW